MRTKAIVAACTGVYLLLCGLAFSQDSIPIHTIKNGEQFVKIIKKIAPEEKALFVFDIDNTLLITNNNEFGSDWWFEQSSKNPALRLNIADSCLYNVLTPLFYSVFDTRPVFRGQAESLYLLQKKTNKTIALTSRGYTPVIATATELELAKNGFRFMEKDSLMMNNKVLLLNNIIYTAGQNKGNALMNYVQLHKYSKIYYFDDSENKVIDVQKAFTGSGMNISLYHLTIAAKIPYTTKQITYMQLKLCNLIQSVNNIGKTTCNCKIPMQ